MSLTPDDVRKVAHLARLGLDETQVAEYATELSSILDVVDHLATAQTDDVAPMSHPLDLSARLRPDVAQATVDREAFQAIAPDTADGVYRVPKVIE
ncbi:Asp-tRNA(Asn)/Glu-tRNA(Gln) amidotransferase subunit GatC [Salinisphaera sp. Q1T1-3]|uniref:Asp-tRNA(Asn)/Glu-tRNA(Gln) amidotransferase subunit GatC n=1 Tax=Salinisphaera sp. Q1T1-3 TaxID=2321229 RepID=UPI000E752E27|nr:Asp-tRNA(Asn)/Glu-tRNA(Gln) amidotransferase subunit GatC [Salinisphaera sp. Q1T1-3]RJS94648.1 Asp-tRNA(Asn)/Glu-tRNA(Gln) amidotransferase subunit GatC [Salinisphaera sp. Q1T1-3]